MRARPIVTRFPRFAGALWCRALLLGVIGGIIAPRLAAQAPSPAATATILRVIRTTPSVAAQPMSEISVSFDRPVAGSLERSVDPAAVMRIAPQIAGRFEWRDPVTLRFIPARPLPSDTRFTVTVGTGFTSMDGSRLARAHEFAFRVRGPIILAGDPLNLANRALRLVPNQRFDFVFSDSVDAARLEQLAHFEMASTCAPRIIRVRVGQQRRITDADGYRLRDAGGWQRDRTADSLRRIVSLFPRAPLPRNCSGDLVLPVELATGEPGGMARWPFEIFGPLRIATLTCGYQPAAMTRECATGPLVVTFTTPVSGAEVQRRLRIVPALPFTLRDTAVEAISWALEARLAPRTTYAVVADTQLRDVFGQSLAGARIANVVTTGYEPSVTYPIGRQTVERTGFRTLPVQHVNADTLVARVAAIPDSLEPQFLARFAWGYGELWPLVAPAAREQRIPVAAARDRAAVTGLALPVSDATRAGSPTLFAVRVSGTAVRDGDRDMDGAVSLVQVTNLGVTARIGVEQGMVWVTGVDDGRPREGARVTLHASDGRVLTRATSDAQGLARLTAFAEPLVDTTDAAAGRGRDAADGGYVSVVHGADRALVAANSYDPDLSSWAFGVGSAWGSERFPMAGAVFTERGIYRPGESVEAKAIVRVGTLGSLQRPVPGDSMRWVFSDRDGTDVLTRTVALSEFGTTAQRLDLPASAAVGTHQVRIEMRRRGAWRSVGATSYRVAEYRPPEFLMDLSMRRPPQYPGDAFTVGVSGRYLFGAPMGRAAVTWETRTEPVPAWELRIPGTDGWYVGRNDWAWRETEPSAGFFASGTDTLDARGERAMTVTLPARASRGPERVVFSAAITDVNRQVVGSAVSALVHPAAFYLATRAAGSSWFWRANEAQRIAVRAVRPDGSAVEDARVSGVLVRREWHQVRRERDGVSALVGEWVNDTVSRCAVVTTAPAPATCVLTPTGGGMHRAEFTASDAAGRVTATTFGRWVTGEGFVPWSDESQFKMDVIADRDRYEIGDTATVMLAAPFTDAEAWVTVEREQVIEQRRLRLTSGATTLKIPITEAFAPNAFISVVVVRGRSAPPGKLDDPGRPTMRVGYAEIRVTPAAKRLVVQVAGLKPEYRPGDTASVRVDVRDIAGRGARSEVTLWAVDLGVLALTAYKTPDPLDLLYQPRELGLRLTSNLVAVTPQMPEGEKGQRAPGGGGGADGADVLRSRFKTTAFFLGSVVTDSAGRAVVTASLPDNLTTFRVMAVAVTTGDRYGSGDSELLVTRPVVARPALPRFVRPGDDLLAGTVVNRRDAAASTVSVRADVTGVALRSPATQEVALAAGRGTEARFRFLGLPGDSAAFRFDVRSGSDLDAVRLAVPIKPDHHPRSHTIAGLLHDSASVRFTLPAEIDPARSRLTLSLGVSPLAAIRGMRAELRVYPYDCSEQISSAAMPMLALLRAEGALDDRERAIARTEVARGVAVLLRRQRSDGGIGFWGAEEWTTPWLSAFAGQVLLDARALGIAVDTVALGRLAEYLRVAVRSEPSLTGTPVSGWYASRWTRLADQVAAADFLSRFGTPDLPMENELVRNAAQMARTDRSRLATMLVRRGERGEATRLLAPLWESTRVEGRVAVLPADTTPWYFRSSVREAAELLVATLAVQPAHPLVRPLVERLVTEVRGSRFTTTQDQSYAVRALAAFGEATRSAAPRTIEVRQGRRVLARVNAAASDTSLSLTGLLGDAREESRPLELTLGASAGTTPAFYYLTVTEVPSAPPVKPAEAGFRVERWYERFTDGQPITSAVEGDLVRVRLRVTVPSERRFVVLDDALPGGLEAVDLSLRTSTTARGPGAAATADEEGAEGQGGGEGEGWRFGSWDSGWWTPWDHREIRDDRVVYAAALLWAGTWSTTYVARATTPGVFIRPPAHAEEMYNPGVNGRSDGGTFTVTARPPR